MSLRHCLTYGDVKSPELRRYHRRRALTTSEATRIAQRIHIQPSRAPWPHPRPQTQRRHEEEIRRMTRVAASSRFASW